MECVWSTVVVHISRMYDARSASRKGIGVLSMSLNLLPGGGGGGGGGALGYLGGRIRSLSK